MSGRQAFESGPYLEHAYVGGLIPPAARKRPHDDERNKEDGRDDQGRVGTAQAVRRWIEQLGPYQSLALLAIPTGLVEPLKLVAVAIAGEGHLITGTVIIILAYAASLFVVERLFTIVKPKLLTLRWFARCWSKFVILRYRFTAPFRHIFAR